MFKEFNVRFENVEMIGGADNLLENTNVTKVIVRGDNKMSSLISTMKNCSRLDTIDGEFDVYGVKNMDSLLDLTTLVTEITLRNINTANISASAAFNNIQKINISGISTKVGIQGFMKNFTWDYDKHTYTGEMVAKAISKTNEFKGYETVQVDNSTERASRGFEIQGQTYQNLANGSAETLLVDPLDFTANAFETKQFDYQYQSKLDVKEVVGNTIQNVITNPNNTEETCDFLYTGSSANYSISNTVASKIRVDELQGQTYQNLIDGLSESFLVDDFTFSTVDSSTTGYSETNSIPVYIDSVDGELSQGWFNLVTSKQIVDAIVSNATEIGGTASLNADGTITTNIANPQTSFAQSIPTLDKSKWIKLKPSTKYSICCYRDNGTRPGVYAYNSTSSLGASTTFTTDSTGLMLFYPASAQGGKVTIRLVEDDVSIINSSLLDDFTNTRIIGASEPSVNLIDHSKVINANIDVSNGGLILNDLNFYVTDFIPVSPNINYIVSSKYPNSCTFVEFTSAKVFVKTTQAVSGIVTSSTTAFVRLRIRNSDNTTYPSLLSNFLSYEFQLEKGIIPSDYCKYGQFNLEVCTKNENLFMPKKYTSTAKNITATSDGTGTIRLSTTGSTGYQEFDLMNGIAGVGLFGNENCTSKDWVCYGTGEYVVSVMLTGTWGSTITVSVDTDSASYDIYVAGTGTVKNMTYTIKKGIRRIRIRTWYSQVFDFTVNVQVSKGNTWPTTITPQKKSQARFVLDQPLMKLGTDVDQLYWDSTKGYYCIKKCIGKVVLDGNDSSLSYQVVNNGASRTVAYSYRVFNVTNMKNYTKVFACDLLPFDSGIYTKDAVGIGIAWDSGVYVNVPISELSSNNGATAFVNWLKANPITVYYPYETPVIIDLPTMNQKQFLQTYIGTTHAMIGNGTLNAGKIKIKTDLFSKDVMLVGNTDYTLKFLSDKSTSVLPISINLGGTTKSFIPTSGYSPASMVIKTPSTLTNTKLLMTGVGNKVKEVQLFKESQVDSNVYVDGIQSVGEYGASYNLCNVDGVQLSNWTGNASNHIIHTIILKPNTKYYIRHMPKETTNVPNLRVNVRPIVSGTVNTGGAGLQILWGGNSNFTTDSNTEYAVYCYMTSGAPYTLERVMLTEFQTDLFYPYGNGYKIEILSKNNYFNLIDRTDPELNGAEYVYKTVVDSRGCKEFTFRGVVFNEGYFKPFKTDSMGNRISGWSMNLQLTNYNIGNGQSLVHFTVPSDVEYFRLQLSHGNSNYRPQISNGFNNEEIREYIPPTIDKKQILLPVQLQKVGSTPDKFYYDVIRGKWCIEKKVGCVDFTGNEDWVLQWGESSAYIGFQLTVPNNGFKNYSSDVTNSLGLPLTSYSSLAGKDYEWFSMNSTTYNGKVAKSRLRSPDINGIKEFVKSGRVVFLLETPRIIETSYTDKDLLKFNAYDGITYINASTLILPTMPINSVGVKRDCLLKPSTKYTVDFNTSLDAEIDLGGTKVNALSTDTQKVITTPSTLTHNQVRVAKNLAKINNLKVIEGDYSTKNKLQYIEGVNSVGYYDSVNGKYRVDIESSLRNESYITKRESDINKYLLGNVLYGISGQSSDWLYRYIEFDFKLGQGAITGTIFTSSHQDKTINYDATTKILKYKTTNLCEVILGVKYRVTLRQENSVTRVYINGVLMHTVSEKLSIHINQIATFNSAYAFGVGYNGGVEDLYVYNYYYHQDNTNKLNDNLAVTPSNKISILLNEPLRKIGNISDRLYWNKAKGHYCVEKYIVEKKYSNIKTDSYWTQTGGGNINLENSTSEYNKTVIPVCNKITTVNNDKLHGNSEFNLCTGFTSDGFLRIRINQMLNINSKEQADFLLNSLGEVKYYLPVLQPTVIDYPQYNTQFNSNSFIGTNYYNSTNVIEPTTMSIGTTPLEYETSLLPSTTYTIQANVNKNGSTSNLTLNIGGTTKTVTATDGKYVTQMITPTTLTSNTLKLTGVGLKTKEVMLLREPQIESLSYFGGAISYGEYDSSTGKYKVDFKSYDKDDVIYTNAQNGITTTGTELLEIDEIIGNTYQNSNNLSEVYNVGELQVDGSYKIDVLSSNGNNWFPMNDSSKWIKEVTDMTIVGTVKIIPNTKYEFKSNQSTGSWCALDLYDSNGTKTRRVFAGSINNYIFITNSNEVSYKFFMNANNFQDLQSREIRLNIGYDKGYTQDYTTTCNKVSITLPQPLIKTGGTSLIGDKLYWDTTKNMYCIDQRHSVIDIASFVESDFDGPWDEGQGFIRGIIPMSKFNAKYPQYATGVGFYNNHVSNFAIWKDTCYMQTVECFTLHSDSYQSVQFNLASSRFTNGVTKAEFVRILKDVLKVKIYYQLKTPQIIDLPTLNQKIKVQAQSTKTYLSTNGVNSTGIKAIVTTGKPYLFALDEPLRRVDTVADRLYYDKDKKFYCIEKAIESKIFDSNSSISKVGNYRFYVGAANTVILNSVNNYVIKNKDSNGLIKSVDSNGGTLNVYITIDTNVAYRMGLSTEDAVINHIKSFNGLYAIYYKKNTTSIVELPQYTKDATGRIIMYQESPTKIKYSTELKPSKTKIEYIDII